MRPQTNYALLAQRLVPHAMVAFHLNVFHVDRRNCCCIQGHLRELVLPNLVYFLGRGLK